jgi:hypothetical protein
MPAPLSRAPCHARAEPGGRLSLTQARRGAQHSDVAASVRGRGYVASATGGAPSKKLAQKTHRRRSRRQSLVRGKLAALRWWGENSTPLSETAAGFWEIAGPLTRAAIGFYRDRSRSGPKAEPARLASRRETSSQYLMPPAPAPAAAMRLASRQVSWRAW